MHIKYKNTPLHTLPVETSVKPKETINNPPRYTKSEFKKYLALEYHCILQKNIQY